MKFAFGLFVVLWIFCGLIGAWMLDDGSLHNWEVVALGPMTLIKAINENPDSLLEIPD